MECNKFSDNLQNCTIQTSHNSNRFRNDRPTCSARDTEYSFSSRLSRAISSPLRGGGTIIRRRFSSSREHTARFIAANYIPAYMAYRGNGPLLFRQWRRERAGVTIPTNLSPDLPPPRPLRHSIPRERSTRKRNLAPLLSQLATEFANESNRSRSSSTR